MFLHPLQPSVSPTPNPEEPYILSTYFIYSQAINTYGPVPFERFAQTWLLGTPDGNWQTLSDTSDQMTIIYGGNSQSGAYDEYTSRSSSILNYAVGPNGNPTIVYTTYYSGNGGPAPQGGTFYGDAVSPGTPYADPTFATYASSMSMVYDSQGILHMMWAPNNGPGLAFRDGFDGAIQVQPELNSPLVDLYVDGRDQIHFFAPSNYPLAPTSAITAYSRLRDPSGQLSPTFAPGASFSIGQANIPYYVLVPANSPQHFMVLSANNRLHWSSPLGYMFSEQAVLGVRDPGAMLGAFPHGQANVTTGNVFSRINLFSTTGAGPTQAMDLAYNSLEPGEGFVGASWTLSAEVCLIDSQFPISTNVITLVQPDGRRIPFYFNSLYSAYVSDYSTGVFARIEQQGTADLPEYKLTAKTGEILWFNAAGRLHQMVDTLGNTMDLRFDEQTVSQGAVQGQMRANHLVEIRDVGGQRFSSIQYDGGSTQFGARIAQITDPGGSSYTLSYQGRSLSSVTFSSGPGAPTYSFDYYPMDDPANGGRLGLLNHFTTPRGNTWTCLYHASGRLYQVQDPLETFLPEALSDTAIASPQMAVQTLRYDGGATWLTDRRGVVTRMVGDGLCRKTPGVRHAERII